MKTCDYCGKENEDISTHCAGCGTILQAPEETPEREEIPERPKLPRTLDAKNATIICLAFFVAAAIAVIIAVVVAEVAGVPSSRQLAVAEAVGGPLAQVFGGVVMIYLACKLIPDQIRDASPTGAAWIRGPLGGIGKAFAIGLVIGLCNDYLSLFAFQHGHYLRRNSDPWNRMAFSPGLQQIVWIVSAVVLAPTTEEMLFRGILYGGFRKSFGGEWAAFLVTGFFVLLHFPNYIDFLPFVIPQIAVAVAMLWCRLRWAAIGPAIAMHAGYNSMVALAVVHWSWR